MPRNLTTIDAFEGPTATFDTDEIYTTFRLMIKTEDLMTAAVVQKRLLTAVNNLGCDVDIDLVIDSKQHQGLNNQDF